MLTRFGTEYMDISVLLDGVSLVKIEYREGANQKIKPTYYKVGSYLYKIGSKDDKDLAGVKCIYSGANQNANFNSSLVYVTEEVL
ncbi:MAG: hypothetical protein JXQ67_05180 [Campylobacterales bacterium]|nr:hypothetical protein [Campylobacterales bacterium]